MEKVASAQGTFHRKEFSLKSLPRCLPLPYVFEAFSCKRGTGYPFVGNLCEPNSAGGAGTAYTK